MGEVYRATDTKLKRQVAIKILPEAFAADADRVARFQREATTLASLNHPNIGGIHGLEEANGVTALVMELVEGEDLAQHIARGVIPIEEALTIACQIANALEAAHEQGIIHRDLKPANIKVRPDGKVKVLDFGLAKAIEATGSRANVSASPTITTPAMTQAGIILGTVAYMSPEQARGTTVDHRTDVWAFGCVLYEMLAGRQAFPNCETVSDTIAGILKGEPDWKALPSGIPAKIRSLLERCLRKDVRRRIHDIADARIEIEEARGEPEPAGVATAPPIASRRRAYRAWMLGLVIVSAAALAFRALLPAAPDIRMVRFDVSGPEGSTVIAGQPLSPDGRKLAFAVRSGGTQRMWVRTLDSSSAQSLPGTEGASRVFWSPDSQHIGFSAQGQLKRVSAAGGPPIVIGTVAGSRDVAEFWASWSSEDVILFSVANAPLLRVPAAGGEPSPAIDFAENETRHDNPDFLPDGRHFLYTAERPEGLRLYVGDLESKDRHLLPGIHSGARYSPTGHVIFLRDRTLMAQRFDLRRLTLSGDAFPISEQLLGATTAAPFSISSNGSLAYHLGGSSVDSQLVWFDRSGNELGPAGPKGDYTNPELSPDGRHVAFGRGDPPNIWVRNIQNGIDTQFSFHRAREFTPIWSPDGQTIAFYSEQDQKVGTGTIYTRPFGSIGEDKRLVKSEVSIIPADWSRDGHYLAYISAGDVWVLRDPLSDNPKPQRVTQTAFTETNPRISPDGHWIAYESNQSGRHLEVHIQSFPQPGVKQQVSNGGGLQPRWKPDSEELFYVTPDFTTVMAVGIKPVGTSLSLEAPVSLFQARMHPRGLGRSYSVSADGRFLINVAVADQGPAPIIVIHNWAASLKK